MADKLKGMWKSKYEYFIASLIAVAIFLFLFGGRVLDVTYTDFLVGDYEILPDSFGGMDSTQHYYGWRAYRESQWMFPLGCFDTLSYPNKNCIIFSDSLPLLAVLFKLISPILPETFQYFGLWGLLCFVLQAVMSIRILRHYINNKSQLILISVFFVVMPMFLWRMFMHTALDSQWLILMALEPLFSKKEKNKNFKQSLKYYSIIAFLAASIHIYLLFFCGIVLAGYCLYMYFNKAKWYYPILLVLSYITCAAFVIAILGGFSVPNTGEAVGLNSISMNLNSLFDSAGYSLFLPPLLQYHGEEFFKTMQFEGYAYLGLGVIGLGILVLILLIFKVKSSINMLKSKKIISLLSIMLVALILALSPTATLGDRVLYHIELPEFIYNIWSIFRATGRASWILVYILVLLIFIGIAKFFTKNIATIIISICLMVQICDNSPFYLSVHNFFSNDIKRIYTYEYAFSQDEFWDLIAQNDDIEHILIGVSAYPYNDESWSSVNGKYYIGIYPQNFQIIQFYMGDFAISNNKTLNYFLFARNKYLNAREDMFDSIADKERQGDSIYIFWEENKFQAFATGYNVYYADGLYVAYGGKLDDRYLVNCADCPYIYDFEGNGSNGFELQGDSALMYDVVELAEGNYILDIEADGDGVVPIIESAYFDTNYIVNYLKEENGHFYYSVYCSSSDSTTCLSVYNNSDRIVDIKCIKISRY